MNDAEPQFDEVWLYAQPSQKHFAAPKCVVKTLATLDYRFAALLLLDEPLDVESLLAAAREATEKDPEPTMAGWMFANSQTGYMSPGYAAPPGTSERVCTSGSTTLHVKGDGLHVQGPRSEGLRLSGAEAGAGWVTESGDVVPADGAEQERLLDVILAGNQHVTAVPAGFSLVALRPLLQMQAFLSQVAPHPVLVAHSGS